MSNIYIVQSDAGCPTPFPIDILNAIAAHNQDPNAHPNGIAGTPGSGGGGSLPWEVLTATEPLAVNRAYAVNGLSRLVLTLPTTATQGDRLTIYSVGAAGWRLQQNAGQQIIVGDKATTVGITGAIESIDVGDLIALTYISGVWVKTGMEGNLEVL